MKPYQQPRLAALALACSLLLAACGKIDNATPDISEHLTRSRAYAAQGQFKAAMIESGNAIEAAPGSVEAILALADIYNTLHYHAINIELLEPLKAHADPRIPLALARAYAQKGKLRSATGLLGQLPATLSAEQSREVALLRADIAMQQRDFAGARAQLTPLGSDREAQLRLAQIEMLQQHWPQATARLEPLAKDGHATATQLLASIAARTGQLEQAEELLTNLLLTLPKTDILTPERAAVLRELMQVVTRQGRSNEALVYAKLLADSAPQQAQVEDKLREAVESYQKGDLADSKKLLAELHNSMANKAFTGQFLGMISFMQGDTAAAEQLLSSYIDPETASNKTLQMLAISQLNQNKPEALLALVEKERAKFDNDALLQAFYGVALLMEGKRALGMRALQRSIELDGQQVYAPLALARAHLAQTQHTQAIDVLTQAHQRIPNEKRLQSAIVGAHLQNGDTAAALRFIEAELAQQPQNVSLLLLASVVQLRAGVPARAEAALQQAQQIEPGNADVTGARAQLALHQQQWSLAREQFTRLIAQAPKRPLGYEGLLGASAREGKLAEGIAALEQLTKNSDHASLPLAALARHALANADVARAEDYATRATRISPDDDYTRQTFVAVMSTLAQQALAEGKIDTARVNTVRALELAPGDPRLLALLAQIELQSGAPKEAQRIAERLQAEHPVSAWGQLVAGDVLRHDGKAADALAAYRKGWDLEKTDLAASRILAALQTDAGDAQARARFLDEWLTALPASDMARLHQAMHLHGANDLPGAARAYEQLVATNPAHVIALNNLAWIYLEQNDARAQATAEKAWQLAPNDAAVTDTYGWVLVQSGQRDKGIALLEQALALKPDATDIKAHLEQAKAQR